MPEKPTESVVTDPKDTRLSFLIRQHYRELGDLLEFPPHRYRSLAAALKMNIYELGYLVRLAPCQVDKAIEAGRFSPPVELSLYMIRQALITGGRADHSFPRLPIDEPESNPPPCSSTSTS